MKARTEPPRGRVLANGIRASLGNFLEYFDWFIYASFSLYFAASFFPSENKTAQLLSTSLVFALGFLMRPIGSWLLGRFSDAAGRRAALTLSVALMSAGSLLIACTPSFATIGVAAPILLTVARLLQGLSLGGEWGSSAAYLAEIAGPGRRGLFSGIGYVAVVFGQLLSVGVLLVLQHFLTREELQAWGWRIPFLLGAAMGLVIFYLRRAMDESDQYETHKREAAELEQTGIAPEKKGLLAVVAEYPKQFIVAILLVTGGTVSYYTYTIYMSKYMVNTAGFDENTAATVSFAALFIFMALQPVTGALSDKIGRRTILLIFSGGIMLVTVPAFMIISQTDSALVVFGLMSLGVVLTTGYSALAGIVKAELFPTKIRALAVGLSHAVGNALFGGTTESVALSFKGAGHESGFYWYVVLCAGMTFFAALFLYRDTSKQSVLDTPSVLSDAAADRLGTPAGEAAARPGPGA
ncbi:MFS transporter [Nonomuraea sp. NPDC049750]|uniref:MFS transporter n=1 Tax=Nonomuraea sp. NPDC049750 TaxID=3154738 RepID=UPI0033D853D6